MATGHWLLQRQVIATLALIVIVTTGAVLLFTRHEQGQKQQQPVTQGSPQVVYKAAPEPLPSPVAPRPPPAPRLKTGTNIWTHEKGSGRGTLRVNNGTSYDAAVTLLDEETGMVRRLSTSGHAR